MANANRPFRWTKKATIKNDSKISDLKDAKNTNPSDILKDFKADSLNLDKSIPLRVSIREYEFYESDTADAVSNTVHGINNNMKLRSRIVYADIIQIR